MNREYYDGELTRLDQLVQTMGAQVLAALDEAVAAASGPDKDRAERVIAGDTEIDRMEREIEQLCVTLLLRQQPVAGDLRRVSTNLKLVTDLERIGDHAADIAEIVRTLDAPLTAPLAEMLGIARAMVESALRAAADQNLEGAHATIQRDDEVDAAFCRLKEGFIRQVAAGSEDADAILDGLMIGKYAERIGDHAVNICEWVICRGTGLYHDQRIM